MKKYGRAKFIAQATSITCGITSSFLSSNGELVSAFFKPFFQLGLLFVARDLRERFQNMRKLSNSLKQSFSQSANSFKKLGKKVNLRYRNQRDTAQG